MQGHREEGVEEGIKVCPKCGLPITRLYKNKKGDRVYYIAYHKIGRRQYRLCYLGPEEYKYGVKARGVLETSKIVGGMELRIVNVDELKFLYPIDEVAREYRDRIVQSFAEAIRASIEMYGAYPNPIHVSSDGYVIDGTMRVDGARKLGLKEIPAIIHKIECSKEMEKCLLLRFQLNLISERSDVPELARIGDMINKIATEYLETLDGKSRRRLLEQLRKYRATMHPENEEPLRSFLNYMMKKTGLPSSAIVERLHIP